MTRPHPRRPESSPRGGSRPKEESVARTDKGTRWQSINKLERQVGGPPDVPSLPPSRLFRPPLPLAFSFVKGKVRVRLECVSQGGSRGSEDPRSSGNLRFTVALLSPWCCQMGRDKFLPLWLPSPLSGFQGAAQVPPRSEGQRPQRGGKIGQSTRGLWDITAPTSVSWT